jgi:hypothetical protein
LAHGGLHRDWCPYLAIECPRQGFECRDTAEPSSHRWFSKGSAQSGGPDGLVVPALRVNYSLKNARLGVFGGMSPRSGCPQSRLMGHVDTLGATRFTLRTAKLRRSRRNLSKKPFRLLW